MAIVSCPECQKKLKIADASIGKKVKCTCGHVFVAETDGAPPPLAAPVSADKVVVACTECGSKLKVATASLGKKMKCPKCAAVFVAAVETPPDAPPSAKAAPADEDDLFGFAQGETDEDGEPVRGKGKRADAEFGQPDEAPIKGKGKPAKRPVPDDMDDDEPWNAQQTNPDDDEFQPKAKAGKKGAKPTPSKTDPDAKPVYPSRLLLNMLVFLMILGFIAAFAALFFGKELGPMVGLKNGIHADLVGFPNPGEINLGVKHKMSPEDKARAEEEIANKKDLDALQGTWFVVSAEKDGVALKGDMTEKLEFKGDVIEGRHVGTRKFMVDAGQKPKTIDLAPQGKGGPSFAGIYKLEADTLFICLPFAERPKGKGKNGAPAGARPTDFVSKNALLLVLKREAPKDEKAPPPEDNKNGDANKGDAAKLEGVWIFVSAEEYGKPNTELKGTRFSIKNGKITCSDFGIKGAPFTVDPSQTPAWLDTESGKKIAAIYKLDGNKLYLCGDFSDGGERPTAFNSKESGYYILQREGKKEPREIEIDKEKGTAKAIDRNFANAPDPFAEGQPAVKLNVYRYPPRPTLRAALGP